MSPALEFRDPQHVGNVGADMWPLQVLLYRKEQHSVVGVHLEYMVGAVHQVRDKQVTFVHNWAKKLILISVVNSKSQKKMQSSYNHGQN